jgi:hypothetical protein
MLKKQRGTISIVALVAGGLLCVFCVPTLAQPIEIDSIEELQKIGNDPGYPLSGDYVLTQDIDAAQTEFWNSGAGFVPIGNTYNKFFGSFDGQHKTIFNLYINNSTLMSWSGLFGYLGSGGNVTNLFLENICICGRYGVGGFAGKNDGTLTNVSVTGTLRTTNAYVGGLSGWNDGFIDGSSANAEVRGWDYVGGLAGQGLGTINNCFSESTVEAKREYAGGIIGWNRGTLTGCYSTGDVVASNRNIGGLAGANDGQIHYCYSVGMVTGENHSIGGLVGSNSGQINNSYAAGMVYGYQNVGGLTGTNYASGTINMCYATGPVEGTQNIGGLLGNNNSGSVSQSYAVGCVSADLGGGGLIGLDTGTSTNCFWDSETTGQGGPAGAALPTSLMMQASTFAGAGWDFDNVWLLREASSYPFFQGTVSPDSRRTINVTVFGGGSIELIPLSDDFDVWSLLTITATPDPGFVFAGWVGPGYGISPLNRVSPLFIAVDHDVDLQAVFIEDGPINITSVDDLQRIGRDSQFPSYWHYLLTDNLDAHETSTWNNGKGFAPLPPFRGTFDGRDHVISDLNINRINENYVGLFSILGRNADVRNTGL